MTVVILAAGTSSRMVRDVPKHLLEVNGEPVIARTVRQLRAGGVAEKDLWLVTRNEAVKAACSGVNVYELPAQTKCTTETFFRTRSLWYEDSVALIILGDVMFTDAAVRKMLEDDQGLCLWYTDTQDIFAVKMHRWSYPCVLRAAKRVFSMDPLENDGRLWQVHFACKGAHKNQCHIDDETQDFDSAEDYDNWLKGVSKNKLFAAKTP